MSFIEIQDFACVVIQRSFLASLLDAWPDLTDLQGPLNALALAVAGVLAWSILRRRRS